ncbi:hypothetical protein [Hirschia maritima]|uniref:hypothetical protein n=1 Tax=Hirschia maritima TaxID=1121961 RepID=UPI0003741556|nr:hypothetical protein [Hirschia maritima]
MSGKKEKSILPKLILLLLLAGIAVGGSFYFANQAEKNAPAVEEIRMEATNVKIR